MFLMCSIREGDHLTQVPPPNHQVATKKNLGDQGQVLKDQKGRRNTTLEANTRAKAKMRLMVLYRYRNSLAVLRVDTLEDLRFVFIKYSIFNRRT